MTVVMADDDSIDDDVFETKETTAASTLDVQQTCTNMSPSPTGYRNYKPPEEVLRMCKTDNLEENEQIVHKTILLGDSGVGKTSLLVQFDTGKFQSGNYSATVGIGFTLQVILKIFIMEECQNYRRVVKVRPQNYRDTSDEVETSNITNRIQQKNDESPSTVDEKEQYDIFCKVMLLGDSGVGKTCLLVRFRDGLFLSGNFISTVGIDFRNKVVNVGQSKVKLQIWDTAGQERFRSVTHAYYRDAHALLLLYDVTNKTSFDNIRAWLGEIREYAQDDVVIMLLGNKCDCSSEREVRKEEGDRLAREYNVTFMETSAKNGLNVELAFLAVARELKCRKSNEQQEDGNRFNVQDFVREQSQQQSCPPCIT